MVLERVQALPTHRLTDRLDSPEPIYPQPLRNLGHQKCWTVVHKRMPTLHAYLMSLKAQVNKNPSIMAFR